MEKLASEYVRTHWRDTLDRVFRGETIAIVRYGKVVAVMVPPEKLEGKEKDGRKKMGVSITPQV